MIITLFKPRTLPLPLLLLLSVVVDPVNLLGGL